MSAEYGPSDKDTIDWDGRSDTRIEPPLTPGGKDAGVTELYDQDGNLAGTIRYPVDDKSSNNN